MIIRRWTELDAHERLDALYVDPFISNQSRFLLPPRNGYARKRKHCPWWPLNVIGTHDQEISHSAHGQDNCHVAQHNVKFNTIQHLGEGFAFDSFHLSIELC